jgi:putative ABC transport system permease protein
MPAIHLRAGRLFRPAVHELIVGKTLYTEERGLEIGGHVRMRGDDWLVVGHFDGGGWMDSAALADDDTLMSAFKLEGYRSVQVMLDSPADFDTLKGALKANPSINVEVQREAEFLAEQAKGITGVLDFVSYLVGGIMAAGATLGAVNAMYALVDQRRREIATLRAIGFESPAIIAAVLIESMLLALPGAALGALLATLLFNGHHMSPWGVALDLEVTPHIVALGILWALCMGLIGGLLPALRAAHVPVATALRAS